MGYLFLQTWLWILFAGLLGLFVGWWVWGKRSQGSAGDSSVLQRKLEQCQVRCAELEAANSASEAGYDSSASGSAPGADTVVNTISESDTSDSEESASESASNKNDNLDQQNDADIQEDWRPAGLSGPDGEADDLKRISGVGPVIQRTLNDLGIYHFHQVGAFTDKNIKWVDNYISFPGRIVRENWVSQATLLAEGGDTKFSNRYDRGNKGN